MQRKDWSGSCVSRRGEGHCQVWGGVRVLRESGEREQKKEGGVPEELGGGHGC